MWFVYALLSTLFAGLHTFAVKVAVERKNDAYLLNALCALVSFAIALVFFLLTSSWSAVPPALYWIGIVGGAIYIAYAVMRMEALRYIDSAIFFPLYKVIGPAAAAVIGIVALSEVVDTPELIGIALSCAVPLLLLSRSEHHRQKNLKLGLILMVVSTLLAAISTAIAAWAVKPDASYSLPLIVISHLFTFVFGLLLFMRKRPLPSVVGEIRAHCTPPFLFMAFMLGVMQFLAFYFLLLAFSAHEMSIVYSINAHYIIIPVILSVIFYKEHWNVRKALALLLSMAALMLLH